MGLSEVTVPGGFELDGGWRRTLWVKPWSGRDQIAAGSSEGSAPAAFATRLLSRCVYLDREATEVSEAFARDLQVGDREALMLHLRRVSVGDRLPCVLTCPSCGAELELDLAVTDLLVPPYDHDGHEHQSTLGSSGEGVQVRFRLPTGADQEIAASVASRPEEARRLLLECCLVEIDGASGELSPEQTDALARTMAELDPQADLRFAAECPECGELFSSELDAATYVRDETRSLEGTLRSEIHLLAFHYHWSEAEILALSAADRRAYVRFLLDVLGEEAPA
jgi:hypothetical protein